MRDVTGAMAMMRGLHLAATLSLLGTSGFCAWMLPLNTVVSDRLVRRLSRLGWISGLIALLSGFAWFMLQAAIIADAHDIGAWLAMLPVVAAHTRYGNILMARLGLLLVATLLALPGSVQPAALKGPMTREGMTRGTANLSGVAQEAVNHVTPAQPADITGRGPWRVHLTLVLTATALGLQGMTGHAGAAAGTIGYGLVLSEFLHLLAAGLWLGALVPLGLSLLVLPPNQAAAVCERFSPIGLACVLVLTDTGLAQGLELIGTVPALLGTIYGQIALLKIGLFAVALTLAAANRFWLTDRLAAGAVNARHRLLISVGGETTAGLAVICAAAFMASSPPAAHTPPVWPLSWQFSLIALNEDPALRREVIVSLLLLSGAAVLLVGALLRRRLRVPALVILAVAIVVRGPSLRLLTIEAYPTSFLISPTGFSAASIVRGQTLFDQNCVACHGPEGKGDGPAAGTLRIRAADLTMPHLWEHSDGEMFWWLTHGIDDPEGGLAMPGFTRSLSEEDRWALIDYIRAHNAGLAMYQNPEAGVRVQAPSFPASCPGMTASGIGDLRGHAVLLVAGKAARILVPPEYGHLPAVSVDLRDNASPSSGACIAADPAAWLAYSVLAGVAPDHLAGSGFLVDPNGWLRVVYRPGPAGGPTREQLIAAIRNICDNPIAQTSEGQHEHHH